MAPKFTTQSAREAFDEICERAVLSEKAMDALARLGRELAELQGETMKTKHTPGPWKATKDPGSMATEYRVKWKRKGLNHKRIRYTSMKAAERRLALLTSAEPWLYYGGGNDPSGYQCCSGYECGCGGITVREYCEQKRAEMPPIEYAVIECRPVGAWEPVEQHNTGIQPPAMPVG